MPTQKEEYKNCKMLLVDDDLSTLKMLDSVASALGAKTFLAHDGIEAYKKFKKDDFDVIVSDLKMPIMDGLSLLKKVREEQFFYPFILLTGYADKDISIKALRLGAFDFLERPLDIDVVENIFIKALEMSKKMTESFSKFKEDIPQGQKFDADTIESLQSIAKLTSLRKR